MAWIQTYTGKVFYPMNPDPDDVVITDIARALSMKCRYSGHVKEFYSVAQHSVLVSRHCSPENRLWGLLHDAAEAYLADVPRPVRPHLDGWKAIESRVMWAVAQAFGLEPWPCPAEVKAVDEAILADEQPVLMGPQTQTWNLTVPPLGVYIDPWSQGVAEQSFLKTFEELWRGR